MSRFEAALLAEFVQESLELLEAFDRYMLAYGRKRSFE